MMIIIKRHSFQSTFCMLAVRAHCLGCNLMLMWWQFALIGIWACWTCSMVTLHSRSIASIGTHIMIHMKWWYRICKVRYMWVWLAGNLTLENIARWVVSVEQAKFDKSLFFSFFSFLPECHERKKCIVTLHQPVPFSAGSSRRPSGAHASCRLVTPLGLSKRKKFQYMRCYTLYRFLFCPEIFLSALHIVSGVEAVRSNCKPHSLPATHPHPHPSALPISWAVRV